MTSAFFYEIVTNVDYSDLVVFPNLRVNLQVMRCFGVYKCFHL